MNEINFLPATFAQSEVRRRRLWRQGVLILAALGVMSAWYLGAGARLIVLEKRAASVEAQVQDVRNQIVEMDKLQAQRELLLHQVRVQRELAQPLPHTAVIATVAQRMAPTLALTRISLQTVRPNTVASTTTRSPRGSAPSSQAVKEDLIRIDLMGLSPNDVAVAHLVGELTTHPLFSNVKMHYSRPTHLGLYEARAFRIEMEVPLDRDYRDGREHGDQDAKPSDGAQVDAGPAGGEVIDVH